MTFPAKIGVWNGEDLKGEWEVTIKIDGVRAIWIAEDSVGFGHWESRAAKPLHNLPILDIPRPDGWNWLKDTGTHFELYLGSLKDTVRACRTQHLKPDTPRILPEHLYCLDPLDERLARDWYTDPTAEQIRAELAAVNGLGFEGLVLRQGDKWLKVKPADTLDLRVIGYEEGTGKHKGRLGYLVTRKGRVGTGFSDAQRQQYWNQRARLVGITIEVECMQLTPDGKLRHPRFIRERFDKIAEE